MTGPIGSPRRLMSKKASPFKREFLTQTFPREEKGKALGLLAGLVLTLKVYWFGLWFQTRRPH